MVAIVANTNPATSANSANLIPCPICPSVNVLTVNHTNEIIITFAFNGIQPPFQKKHYPHNTLFGCVGQVCSP